MSLPVYVEIEREHMAALADPIAKIGLTPMAVWDCYTAPDEPWGRWLPDQFAATDGKPVVRFDYAGIAEHKRGQDTNRTWRQMQALADRRSANKDPLAFVYTDFEERFIGCDWTLAGMMAPLIRTGTTWANFNFARCGRGVNYAYGDGVHPLWGVSCPECYCTPGADSPTSWQAWVRTIDCIRQNARMGECIPTLPVVWPTSWEMAKAMTKELIMHATSVGVRRFVWASYMTGLAESQKGSPQDFARRLEMATTIAEAMQAASFLARVKKSPPALATFDQPYVLTAGRKTFKVEG